MNDFQLNSDQLIDFMYSHVVEMDAASFLTFCNAFKDDKELFHAFLPCYTLCLMDPEYVVRFKLNDSGVESIEAGYSSDREWKLIADARVSFNREVLS